MPPRSDRGGPASGRAPSALPARFPRPGRRRSCRDRRAPRRSTRSAAPRPHRAGNAPARSGAAGIGLREGKKRRRRGRVVARFERRAGAVEIVLLGNGKLRSPVPLSVGTRRSPGPRPKAPPRRGSASPRGSPISQSASNSQRRNSRSPTRLVPSRTTLSTRICNSSVSEARRRISASSASMRCSMDPLAPVPPAPPVVFSS
jgi:hypothetical protein